jgi:GT2 family glycosyltransferase
MNKLSFVIPTINRFDYLEKCLISLQKTIKPKDIFVHLTIIDDASDDQRVVDFIKNYEINFVDKFDKIFKETRTPGLCETNLKKIWSKHYDDGYDLFLNLDPDAIFNPNWLNKLIELHFLIRNKQKYNIVTPFDTSSHKKHKQNSKYFFQKKTIGGICTLFNRETYKFIVEPCLFPSGSWDWQVCEKMIKNNGSFYCTPVSYIEHIGKISSARDSNLIPLFDKAINFIGES